MGDPMSPIDHNTNPAVLLSRLHRWRMAFFGLVILLAGFVIGAGAVLIWASHRGPGKARAWPNGPGPIQPPQGEVLVQQLQPYLRLSDQQVQAIIPIVREHMSSLHYIRQEARPKVAEQLRLMDKQISDVLNKDQKRLWDRRFRLLQEQLQWQVPPYRGRPQDPKGPMPARPRQGEPSLPPPPDRGAPPPPTMPNEPPRG